MKLLECSANKLNRMARKKKLIFLGAGNNMYYVLDTYGEYHFEEKVAFIIDGNPDKVGTYVSYKKVKIKIRHYTFLKELNLKEYTMVITALCYKEIFAQVQNLSNEKSLRCYRAPGRRIQVWGLIKKAVCMLPLSDIIVLNGEGDTCENARALGKYIAGKNYFGKYRLVWLCDHPEQFDGSQNELYLNRRTEMYASGIWEIIKYFVNVGRAKYLIYENQIIPKMRSDQMSIYLNHGSPPVKATKGIINLPRDLNWVISPSIFSTDIITEQYGINRERILCCGSPRTDILFDLSDISQIKEEFQMAEFDKMILWTPTFRQKKNSNRIDSTHASGTGLPIIAYEEDFKKLTAFLEQHNILLVLKLHLLQDASYIKLSETRYIRIIDNDELVEHERSVYDLLKCADAMITDYSTIAFDYMLLDRPIGYTLDDFNEYKLGFSVEHVEELMPGKPIFNIEDFLDYIFTVKKEEDIFWRERREVMNLTHDYPDGHNAERLCEMLGWGISK